MTEASATHELSQTRLCQAGRGVRVHTLIAPRRIVLFHSIAKGNGVELKHVIDLRNGTPKIGHSMIQQIPFCKFWKSIYYCFI